jgi:hypothetical protein
MRAGDWVEVLSKAEILATLDRDGRLDGLPFMPEMFQYCGCRLRVSKRAHKTCDPSLGMGGRRMSATVHLENVRCDGQAHDGCEAGCLLFWKEAWLKETKDVAPTAESSSDRPPPGSPRAAFDCCTEEDVLSASQVQVSNKGEDATYICQATHLKFATQALPWWDMTQYLEDYTSGNVRLSQMAAAFLFFLWHHLAESGMGFGSAMRWAYDLFQRVRGGSPYPWRRGRVPKGSPTPSAKLDLRPGEIVRTKRYVEILETLDENWRNRGMYFDGEMVPFTNGAFRVAKRVRQIIDEKTGKVLRFKSDAIILEDVFCQARYAKCRLFCPRAIYPYWREIWLERIPETEEARTKRTHGSSGNQSCRESPSA